MIAHRRTLQRNRKCNISLSPFPHGHPYPRKQQLSLSSIKNTRYFLRSLSCRSMLFGCWLAMHFREGLVMLTLMTKFGACKASLQCATVARTFHNSPGRVHFYRRVLRTNNSVHPENHESLGSWMNLEIKNPHVDAKPICKILGNEKISYLNSLNLRCYWL